MSGPTTSPPARATAPSVRGNPVNGTVVMLTRRVLLGRRRGALFVLLPLVLVLVSILLRWAAGVDPDVAVGFLGAFSIGTVLPLIALLAGTGVIGPEIDDGSIVYLLAKPVPRWHVVVSKLVVASATALVFGALPIYVCGVVLTGEVGGLALGFAIGAALAAIAYCSVFLLLGVISRHAVVLGLVYALIWESLIGGYLPGVKTLSIQQWALAVTRELVDEPLPLATVSLAVAVPALLVTVGLATWYASRRLRSLSLSGEQ